MIPDRIQLRGVAVHNLKHVDVDIPLGQLVVICGVSGSGKTSLALDTLYAEGQRRYLESFSAYTRQFLERLEKPTAEKIADIPPAVAVTHRPAARSSRSTIGTATEVADYLRLLFAKIGRVACPECGIEVRRETPQTISERLRQLAAGTRYLVAWRQPVPAEGTVERQLQELREAGFVRVVVGQRLLHLAESPSEPVDPLLREVYPVVDRLVSGEVAEQRLRDSLETAFRHGQGRCTLCVQADPSSMLAGDLGAAATSLPIDGRPWWVLEFHSQRICGRCGRPCLEPEPRLFSFNSPLGACPTCEGFGNVMDIDLDLVVPDPKKSLRDGAIAPWNSPAYSQELTRLLAFAGDNGIPVDVPFAQLTDQQRRQIRDGVPEQNFAGLRGFFAWLERRKYKMHLRVFLSRWRSYLTCPACQGTRLRPEALAVRVQGRNIAEVSQMQIAAARSFFGDLELPARERSIGRIMLDQIQARLRYLDAVGLGYLTLNRTLRTLSGGESQRVALTCALGSSLVNMLYVLDEPSVGLHPQDVQRMLQAVLDLRDRGNTVVVIEHEDAVLQAADHLIEIGPGAGHRGGEVVFAGSLPEMLESPRSLTGSYLAGRRGVGASGQRRATSHGWIRLTGARGNNLRNLTVDFPLGVLCVVAGVSGAGKSTLVDDTLYGALCQRKKKDAPKPFPYDEIIGDGQIDDVILVDQSPIGRSPRSNPVTYVKAFDPIRGVFAETIEARTHNYSAAHFSFNCDEGRCPECEGDGYIQIDMQFLADVYMKCSRCRGQRYRKEILDITYRGHNIAEVLEMTVREAFSFFRGQAKVLARLKPLLDVGLDYLRLGQPANTLSGGESQRLKLAIYLTTARRRRTLFILDEPTTGLHFADVVQLLDCFEALLSVGHSLIVVEHNLQMIKAADYIIDLGPGAAEAGGCVVAHGTPETLARHASSVTGRWLAPVL